jgi:hypothetical protein
MINYAINNGAIALFNPDKASLGELLAFQKYKGYFVEIFADGSAEVQKQNEHEDFVFFVDGPSLKEALQSAAKKEFGMDCE